mmetsp:Transcript_1552/g.4596  ORF Transcript_1552/g.4596 Transcript_1552/m.4596 type:complete len:185 (+) Transcript_1552:420-974(+)
MAHPPESFGPEAPPGPKPKNPPEAETPFGKKGGVGPDLGPGLNGPCVPKLPGPRPKGVAEALKTPFAAAAPAAKLGPVTGMPARPWKKPAFGMLGKLTFFAALPDFAALAVAVAVAFGAASGGESLATPAPAALPINVRFGNKPGRATSLFGLSDCATPMEIDGLLPIESLKTDLCAAFPPMRK